MEAVLLAGSAGSGVGQGNGVCVVASRLLVEAASGGEAECSEGWQLVDVLARTLRAMDWVAQGQALRSLTLVVPAECRGKSE